MYSQLGKLKIPFFGDTKPRFGSWLQILPAGPKKAQKGAFSGLTLTKMLFILVNQRQILQSLG
jgi:hypothetical protein